MWGGVRGLLSFAGEASAEALVMRNWSPLRQQTSAPLAFTGLLVDDPASIALAGDDEGEEGDKESDNLGVSANTNAQDAQAVQKAKRDKIAEVLELLNISLFNII